MRSSLSMKGDNPLVMEVGEDRGCP
jgi:hypothetical protein